MDSIEIAPIETGPTEDSENTGASSEETSSESSVPEKFQNKDGSVNVDALLKSYTELEKNRTTPNAAEETDENSAVLEGKTFTPEEVSYISSELAAHGEPSKETYDLLESKGLSKEMADSYLEGQRAIAAKIKEDLWEPVGGEEAYGQMLEWAADNMSQPEIDAYDKAMLSEDTATKQLLIQGLAARYNSENAASPNLIRGTVGSEGASNGFGSWAQVKEAMRDPRYDKDEAYRSTIDQRLNVSNL